jgi:hypothetical protein
VAELRAIDGGKRDRAKRLANARIVECRACGGRSVIEVRTGVAVAKDGKIVHRGTRGLKCAQCGAVVE